MDADADFAFTAPQAALQRDAFQPESVFERAAQRGAALELNYTGAVTPPEAWALAQTQAAVLVDVRTEEELKQIGRVPGAVHVEWLGPAGQAQFLAALQARVAPNKPILFLCRSAVRSHHAATLATAAGFAAAYNVLEGFEGQLDAQQQRGRFDGWRHHGLPWIQD